MDLDEHQTAAIDKYLNATYGLWNSLLTVNGITLSIFSALYTITPSGNSLLVRVIIGACVVSACLLISNHLAIKSNYYRIVEVLHNPENQLTGDERARDQKNAEQRRKFIRFNETTSLCLFLVEVACIAVFVWNHPPK